MLKEIIMLYSIIHQYAPIMMLVCGIVFILVLLLGLLFRSVVKSRIPDLPPVFVNGALVWIIVLQAIQAAIVSGIIALVMLMVMFIAAVLH